MRLFCRSLRRARSGNRVMTAAATVSCGSDAWLRVCAPARWRRASCTRMQRQQQAQQQHALHAQRRWLHSVDTRHHGVVEQATMPLPDVRMASLHVDTTTAAATATAAKTAATTAAAASPSRHRETALRYRVAVLTDDASASPSPSPSLSRQLQTTQPQQQQQARHDVAPHHTTPSTTAAVVVATRHATLLHNNNNNINSYSSSNDAVATTTSTAAVRTATNSDACRCDEAALSCFDVMQGGTHYCWQTLRGHDTTARSSSSDDDDDDARTRACALVVVRPDDVWAHFTQRFAMPRGFPDTTAPGYRRFFFVSQLSAFIANFATSIGTQTLLTGFFVGGTAQLWMLKDLAPALMAAYVANRVMSYEARPKHWFVVSVVMNHATVVADMLIPQLVPGHVLAAAIASATVKQSSALMYFITRASALQHFSICNNLAELTKKFNSFGVVNFTVATALGIAYCSCVTSLAAQMAAVAVCCAANLLVAPMAMRAIHFRILNATTMSVLLRSYIATRAVLTPADVSRILGVRMLPPPLLVTSASSSSSSASSSSFVCAHDAEQLLCVGPPLRRLRIRSDALSREVLYVCRRGSFALALWHTVGSRRRRRRRNKNDGNNNDGNDHIAKTTCSRRVTCVCRALRTRCVAPLRRLTSRLWPRRTTATTATTASTTRVRSVFDVFGTRRLVLLVHHSCSAHDLLTAHLIMYTAVLRHATSEAALCAFVRGCHVEQATWERRAAALRSALRHAQWDVDMPALDHPGHRVSSLHVFARALATAGSAAATTTATTTTATTTTATISAVAATPPPVVSSLLAPAQQTATTTRAVAVDDGANDTHHEDDTHDDDDKAVAQRGDDDDDGDKRAQQQWQQR